MAKQQTATTGKRTERESTAIFLRIPAEEAQALNEAARTIGMSQQEWIRHAIKRALGLPNALK